MSNVRAGLALSALVSLAFLAQPLTAEEHEEHQTGAEAEEHKEDPVTEAQSIDSFSSIEDGQPDEPGEPEFRIVPYGLATHGGENAGGLDVEAQYTFAGSFFWDNFTLGTAFESELAKTRRPSWQKDYQAMQLGRLASGATVYTLDDTKAYLSGRQFVDRYPEQFRVPAYYQYGQFSTSTQNLNSLVNFQQYLLFDSESLHSILQSGRLPENGWERETSSSVHPYYLQRWVRDHGPDSLVPTISTNLELGFPLTQKADNGEEAEFTIVVAKTIGPGTLFLNGTGRAVIGNADRSLRASTYSSAMGYKWDVGEDIAIVGAVRHSQNEERHSGSSSQGELSFQWELGGVAIGPGIVFGLDNGDETPRFGFGVSVLF